VLRDCVTLARQEGISLATAQRRLLGFSDAEVGGALALQWNFPPDLAIAVAQHQVALESLDDQNGLVALVVRARAFARSQGLCDGLEPPALTAPASEWTSAPLAPLLEQGGGLDGLVQRAAVFLNTAAVSL